MTHWLDVGKDGLNYLDNCLCNGKTLSKLLKQRIAVSSGITYALVPQNIELPRLRKFESGGLLPQANENVVPLEMGVIAVPKPNLINAMAQVIAQILRANPERFCVFEELMMRPEDPLTATLPSLLLRYREELYHVCLSGDSTEKVERILRQAHSWACAGVVACPKRIIRSQGHVIDITRESLETIVAGAQFVIVDAYDGESYVVWTEEPYRNELTSVTAPHTDVM